MSKENIIITVLLLLAIVLGALNLKVYYSLLMQNTQKQGVATLGDSNAIHNASGTLVSVSTSALVMNTGGKDISLTLGGQMNFYLREKMSDAKYQSALKQFRANPIVKRTGDAINGTAVTASAPNPDVFMQVKAMSDLNLKSGDTITVAYGGALANGTTILEIVKVVELK